MRRRICSLILAAAVTAALVACASDDSAVESADESGWDAAAPRGYEWVGAGEPQSFAAADQFCRRLMVNSDLRLKATLENVQTGSNEREYPTANDLRSYWQCMEGRGWKAQRPEPEPASAW